MTTGPDAPAETADGTTGRYLILLEQDWGTAHRELRRVAGIQAVDSAEAGLTDPLWEADALVMREVGVALVSADPEQVGALAAAADEPGPIALIEPERVVRAIETVEGSEPVETTTAAAVSEDVYTWGLQAVGAPNSTATGKGIRVGVLDTGFDLAHPDAKGRTIMSKSFVQGQEVQDGHGHGTHCIGTACGPRTPESGPGYGIAYESEIFAGKVLSNEGSGADGGILAGISWALTSGCRVLSMSLGSAVGAGVPYSRTFERVAVRARAQGMLIVAAAGNESKRSLGVVSPVGHPANCPTILAVGAVDVGSQIGDFSCGTVDVTGAVDLVGPGVDVLSSWPMPRRTRRIGGTSMATPHVAGVAALHSQATGAKGFELWARLVQSARRLPLASTDVGAGLVQAP
jgi:subtilisin family serine protease